MAVRKAYSRYYCEHNSTHRVFPYDGFESLTEAPELGKSGQPVLLYSLNGTRTDDRKYAWCWSCDDWVLAFRRTQHEIMLDYITRSHVNLRGKGGIRAQALALAQKLEQRREQR